jgi:hypothetical protein
MITMTITTLALIGLPMLKLIVLLLHVSLTFHKYIITGRSTRVMMVTVKSKKTSTYFKMKARTHVLQNHNFHFLLHAIFNFASLFLQTEYTDGAKLSHGGTDTSDPPATTLTFAQNEMITGMWAGQSGGIPTLGFNTSLGRTLVLTGPYLGRTFSITSPLYGFFGWCCFPAAVFPSGQCLDGWGAWTAAPSPPPPPPSKSPPPLPPPPPPPLPPTVKSTIFVSDFVTDPNPTWDDGPHTGRFAHLCNPDSSESSLQSPELA